MILIIPSSSPWEATLPLYRQANRGSEAIGTQYHTADQRESQESGFRRAGGGFLAQTPGSTSWVDLGVHCPGQCPDAPGRGRQSFHPPINQGGDVDMAFPPECWRGIAIPKAQNRLVTSPPDLGPPPCQRVPHASLDSSPPPPGALRLRAAPPLAKQKDSDFHSPRVPEGNSDASSVTSWKARIVPLPSG